MHHRDSFSIVLTCRFVVYSYKNRQSPYRGDFNEYTQYTIFNIKKKITLNYPKPAAMRFLLRDSRMSSKQLW